MKEDKIIISRGKEYKPPNKNWRFSWKWLYKAHFTDGRPYPDVTIGYSQGDVKSFLRNVFRKEGEKSVIYLWER